MPADIDHEPVTPESVAPLPLSWPIDAGARDKLARVLARMRVEADVWRWMMMAEHEIEAEVDSTAFMFEAQANHILSGLLEETKRG